MSVLFVGKTSYISTCVAEYFRQKACAPEIHFMSVRDDSWRNTNLGQYEIIIFCAAIVHQKKSRTKICTLK